MNVVLENGTHTSHSFLLTHNIILTQCHAILIHTLAGFCHWPFEVGWKHHAQSEVVCSISWQQS